VLFYLIPAEVQERKLHVTECRSRDTLICTQRRNAAEAPSPDPSAVPWLLLEATGHEGSGVLSKVTFIQRINTSGGKAPAAPSASAGEDAGCYRNEGCIGSKEVGRATSRGRDAANKACGEDIRCTDSNEWNIFKLGTTSVIPNGNVVDGRRPRADYCTTSSECTRWCRATGEIAAEGIRREHPSALGHRERWGEDQGKGKKELSHGDIDVQPC